MKLVVAAGILAQTLPSDSQKAADFAAEDDGQTFHLSSILSSIPRDAGGPLSKRPGKRLRQSPQKTQAALFQKAAQAFGGPLRNEPIAQDEGTKGCDPQSNDPDLGILSCRRCTVCRRSGRTLRRELRSFANAS